jgi:hypothetical protein
VALKAKACLLRTQSELLVWLMQVQVQATMLTAAAAVDLRHLYASPPARWKS